ncbi:MAG: hypothetical protein K2H55_02540 [Helicobacter sp.]|nr:hypothetical protein [Helicobacter sp.]
MPALEEKSLLVVFKPKEEYCMCKVFDTIGKQLHALATTQSRHYSYEIMKLLGRGYMVVCFNTNPGKHVEELRKVLSEIAEDTQAGEEQNAEESKDSKKCMVLLGVSYI